MQVLNLSRNSEDRFDDVCTSEQFEQAISEFPEARVEAANLAAHNWNVVVIGDRLLISAGSRGYWHTKDGKESKMTKADLDLYHPEIPADDYSTPSISDWIDNRAVKRMKQIQLAHLGRDGVIFMMVENIMREYRSNILNAHFKRASGEFWEDERQLLNNQRSCKRFRQNTFETINKLYPTE